METPERKKETYKSEESLNWMKMAENDEIFRKQK